MDIVGNIHDRLGNNPDDYQVVRFRELEVGDIFGAWMNRYIYLGMDGTQQLVYDVDRREYCKSWVGGDEEVVSFRRSLLIKLWEEEYHFVRLVRAMERFVNAHYNSVQRLLHDPKVGLMRPASIIVTFLSKI
jgi:hypothetical protein